MVVTTGGLKSCRSQIPWFLIGETGPQRGRRGPLLAIAAGSVVVCRTCTNTSWSNILSRNFQALVEECLTRLLFSSLAFLFCTSWFGICTWSWAVASATVGHHNPVFGGQKKSYLWLRRSGPSMCVCVCINIDINK